MRIIETDNFGADYPDEKFLDIPRIGSKELQAICDIINRAMNPPGHTSKRFWRVVSDDYVLQPGFEP